MPTAKEFFDLWTESKELTWKDEQMKATRIVEQEVEVAIIRIEVPVRYEEEDIPNDFPLRIGDMWRADVEIDTGRIADWPLGKSGKLAMKVCDSGTYTLFDPVGRRLATLENDYCPNKVVPGEWGDYINLEINENGVITNWPRDPDVTLFFKRQQD